MGEATITQAELAAALEGLRVTRGETHLGLFVANPQAFAQALFERAKRAREPEYEPGAVYEDCDGKHWEYRPREDDGGLCCWLKPGEAGRWSRTTPRFPLRRLIAEGSDA